MHSKVQGINHPYLNVGVIEGGTNTNVIPVKVMFKLDRRMIPDENPADVEANIREVLTHTVREHNAKRDPRDAVHIDIKRILMANAMQPLAGNQPLVDTLQKHGS